MLLSDLASDRGIRYFLISFTDLFGVQRAKLVPAQSIDTMAENGPGFAGFAAYLDMTPADPDILAVPDPNSLYPRVSEDILHDMGAISMMGSDSQGMGRIAETICRTWQLASKMKDQRGKLPSPVGEGLGERSDNQRALRYLAKYTINPARTYGIDKYVGSLEPGKIADK